MYDRLKSWLATLPGTPRRMAVLTASVFVAAVALRLSPLGDRLEAIGERAAFAAREASGRSPALHRRLKVLTFDDRMADAVKDDALSTEEWAILLEGLARAQVRAVLIDKIFSLPFEPGAEPKRLRSVLRDGPPVTVGAFTLPNDALKRQRLALTRPDGALSTYAHGAGADGAPAVPSWLGVSDETAYGPHADLASDVRHIGQIMLDGARVRPFVRLKRDVVLPHLALYAADQLALDGLGLTVNGVRVGVDAAGRILPNLTPPAQVYAGSIGLADLYADALAGVPMAQLSAGDTVLILPSLYTGNTDFVETPAGLMPGGFVIAALVNSVLSGAWLGYADPGLWGLLVSCLIGAALGATLRPAPFAAALLATATGYAGLGLGLFCAAGLVVPWVTPLATLAAAAVAVALDRARAGDIQVRRLEQTLHGAVAAQTLDHVLRNPGAYPRDAAEQVVTLMFLDIVGFSAAVEILTPRQAFAGLKAIMRQMAALVHEHGGVVDRSLGDGMLCYFGYNFGLTAQGSGHAEQAFRCAIAIQQQSLTRCLLAGEAGEPVFPLRIGLNTSAAYIGDLGDERRLDFTVIGHGVNLAQRLEAACESHQIMLGATTMSMLTGFARSTPGMKPRLINVKHQAKPLEAFEYNPHVAAPERLGRGVAAHRRFAKLARGEERWPVAAPDAVRLTTDFGPGRLVDYSTSGFAVELPLFLAKGLTVTITVGAAAGVLPQVPALLGEVRWGRPLGERFLHGILVKNLGAEQREQLFQFFRATAGAAAAAPATAAG